MHKYPRINSYQSNNVIHVVIGLPKSIDLTNNYSYLPAGSARTYKSWAPKVSPDENVHTNYSQSEIKSSDGKDMTNDYHQKSKQNKKSKCSRKCFIATLVIIIVLLLITATVLLGIFLKPQSQTQRTQPTNAPVLRWNMTGTTVAGITSSPGNGYNQLNSPYDVILDYLNNIYIADNANNRIQKYMYDTSNNLIIQTVAGNGTPGSSSSQLNSSSRLVMDSNTDLYITDTANARVQCWLYGATSGTTVAGITRSVGNATNQFINPFGISRDSTSGTLYITDRNNHRVMSYASGANNGTLVIGFNGGGTNNTQLYFPSGVYFDSITYSILIANTGANNIVRSVFGNNFWTLVAGYFNGSSGATSTGLNTPVDMILDPMGNMYVADPGNQRIQLYNAGQSNGTTIIGITGVNGSNASTLNGPISVALDTQLNLYVADAFNHRIQKYLRY